jgi:hypothetical protein
MRVFEGRERSSQQAKEQPPAVERLFTENDKQVVRVFINDNERKAAWRQEPKGPHQVRLSDSLLEAAMAYLEGRDMSDEARRAFVRTWLLADAEARGPDKRSNIPSSLSSDASAGPARRLRPKPSLDDYDRRLM